MSMLPKVREIRRTWSSSVVEERARRRARVSSTLRVWGGLAIALMCKAVTICGARNSWKAGDGDQPEAAYPGSVSIMTFWGGMMRCTLRQAIGSLFLMCSR